MNNFPVFEEMTPSGGNEVRLERLINSFYCFKPRNNLTQGDGEAKMKTLGKLRWIRNVS